MPRSLMLVAGVLALCLTNPAADAAQSAGRLDARLERATVAWDEGHYIESLENLIAVLESPEAPRFLEPVALLSGELFVTREVAVDGRNARISADGAYAAYETTIEGETITHVAALGADDLTATSFAGTGFVFAPAGHLGAYLAVAPSDELLSANTALEDADPEDRDAVADARLRVQEARRANTDVVVIDVTGAGEARTIHSDLVEASLTFGPGGGVLYMVGGDPADSERNDIYALPLRDDGASGDPIWRAITEADGFKSNPVVTAGGERLVYSIPRNNPALASGRGGRGPGGRGFGGGGPENGRFGILTLASGDVRTIEGNNPTVSADGSTLAFSSSVDGETVLSVLSSATGFDGEPREILQPASRTGTFALSPNGRRLVVQVMLREDWELFLVGTGDGDGEIDSSASTTTTAAPTAAPTAAAGRGEPIRLTNEIQHDLSARFLTNDTVLAAKGEGRHRRSFLYDVDTLERTRLFHNNTVRTIAPEYEWQASADGTKVLIVSERDGDTVSPERAVYLVDLSSKVSVAEVLERLETSLAAERALRAAGRRMFAPIADDVRDAVSKVSTSRLYGYQKALFDFGSKNITRPGNEPAREYLRETYESFGYEAALQWFEARARGANEPIRTANVLAKLEGTENPELLYVVSSHFDSTARGPGADDNTSGTAMLLETARVLADHPLPYSVVFASFTGEESGLLGSREYVRQAVEHGDRIVGALNNDMMGWSNDHRIDNTIRYSNAGIRDLQHAAAFLFSDLITYDALYYKSTDAAAYYEAYGDIVGGIGSYPVLGNPHYHQTHDVLETINHEQVRETTKTNIASIMLLASSPSRLTGLEVVSRQGDTVELAWEPSPENSVFEYVIRVARPGTEPEEFISEEPAALLDGMADGTVISVKAVSSRGLRGWDWAHVMVGR